MVRWDIDRYEALQDAAWEQERTAAGQDELAKRDGHVVTAETSRTTARAMRVEAAQMLAQFWVPLASLR